MFADVIVDITQTNVDRPFEYVIPEELSGEIKRGVQVNIPFGPNNKLIRGFVINVKDRAGYDPEKLKCIDSLAEKTVSLESTMIELADFIRKNYGGTMNQALKTVLPVKKGSKPVETKFICLEEGKPAEEALRKYTNDKRTVAKARLLNELIREKVLPYEVVRDRLNVGEPTVKSLVKEGLARIEIKTDLRAAPGVGGKRGYDIVLNESQQRVADDIWSRREAGDTRPSLIHGVTGSGKTEIYINLIERALKAGQQAIVLIPEIALTYQTVLRFYRKFGDRISVLNSRLSQAQRHDQLEKARRGTVNIMIGPRSALFSPFKNPGIIIIDEEHEGTYRNENVPRYHAREVAIERARLSGGIVVLGSATPSVESYYKAEQGEYRLYTLEKRAGNAKMAETEIVDLREELQSGNRSMISTRLKALMEDRLSKNEQIMLFINRRGYSSVVSCRNCGTAMKCPHCDVSLKYHRNGRLMCHYCGYETDMVKTCPECGSKYIGTFGTGTQKVEEEVKKIFPEARVLRMDFDTTREKGAYEKILASFANGEADILVGTQMIVKGHDFANVTLVGIMLADLSLYSDNYQAPEKTFQLITQAAGRAGRSEKPGHVIVQTYSPDNYAVRLGADQNYKEFYGFEMDYRKLLGYPPVMNMLGIHFSCGNEKTLDVACEKTGKEIDEKIREMYPGQDKLFKIGPTTAPIAKINDRYRKVIYLKSEDYGDLTAIKDMVEEARKAEPFKDLLITFDFSSIG